MIKHTIEPNHKYNRNLNMIEYNGLKKKKEI